MNKTLHSLIFLCFLFTETRVDDYRKNDARKAINNIIVNKEARERIFRNISSRKGIAFFYKNEYTLMTKNNSKTSYVSSRVGFFDGVLIDSAENKFNDFLTQTADITLQSSDKEAIDSVCDGLIAIISNGEEITYLSDPIVLLMNQNEKFSPRLIKTLNSTMKIIHHLSKFDANAFNYMKESLPCFSGDETYEEIKKMIDGMGTQ